MKHTEYREHLHLLALEELDLHDRTLLEDHLRTCSDCRDELPRLRKFYGLLKDFEPAVHVDDNLLQDARQQLREALHRERSHPSFLETIEERLSTFVAPRYQIALGGLATLALGIFIGHRIFTPSAPLPQEAQLIPANPRITNLKFLDSKEGSDVVEFTFDAVQPVKMRGSVNDPGIQKVLTHAMLNDANPGVRLRALNVVATPRADKPDKEIKAALILTLRTDPNAGVRKEALMALQQYPPDEAIKNALLNTLMTDKNPGLRIAAINGLDSLRIHGQSADRSVLKALHDKMQSDDNTYIRLRARTVLQEARAQ
jgi:hypothetical protein